MLPESILQESNSAWPSLPGEAFLDRVRFDRAACKPGQRQSPAAGKMVSTLLARYARELPSRTIDRLTTAVNA